MTETATKVPVKTENKGPQNIARQPWHPLESLHREVDRLFNDFGSGFWRSPFRQLSTNVEPLWRSAFTVAAPAVDIAEKDGAYEITADLPGLDEKNVEVQVANGNLTIKGEKKEEKEEKNKDYYLQERHFGSFERTFAIPEGVEADKIEASFKKGVLTIALPKKVEAQKPAKKVEIKAA
ncbi:Hsp20/alpha crystallin family protein [Rhodoplanes sp. Z2-YC6860]|uniref:Hsp20/alpha crystallin family protein n=1 Tax=Rhodoplanes sp. Z2-YC6860 TaxID=674703 RepID=UPI00078CA7B1|nr:Hsp20/alpha crystallin family protein [Rhodoplanes sp. Z2-YC6860]AMN38486.1 HspC2 heat shock protein [Rhodoplanes sp. Z2-YC6860]